MFFLEGKKVRWMLSIVAIILIASLFFVQHNASFYQKPIAKISQVELVETTAVTDMHGNEDRLHEQKIFAVLQNGSYKGEPITFLNKYSDSGSYDFNFRPGQQLFVTVDEKMAGQDAFTGEIIDVKRDMYVAMVVVLFTITLGLVGGMQGFYSVISLLVNACILSLAIDLYRTVPSISLVFICGIAALVFTAVSLCLTNGLQQKTFVAIIATILGTVLSLLITYVVIWGTGSEGLHYEEMQFLSRPYVMVFMASLFIGSLGAVMDIAMTMSASLFEIYENNPEVTMQELRKSGRAIGKDIMGTMTNILFLVYVSGSLPMLLLYLKNGASLGFTLSINLSLELARALAGGIGIVLTIPIGLAVALFFIQRKKVRT